MKIKANCGKIICGQDWTGLEVETEPNLVGEEDPLARKLMGGIVAAGFLKFLRFPVFKIQMTPGMRTIEFGSWRKIRDETFAMNRENVI